jgi:hypothetical protein
MSNGKTVYCLKKTLVRVFGPQIANEHGEFAVVEGYVVWDSNHVLVRWQPTREEQGGSRHSVDGPNGHLRCLRNQHRSIQANVVSLRFHSGRGASVEAMYLYCGKCDKPDKWPRPNSLTSREELVEVEVEA